MRIESIGLPGAGKTTLEKTCRVMLEAEGKRALDANALDALDAQHPQGHPRIWRNEKLRQSYHIAGYLSAHIDMHGFLAAHYGSHRRNVALSLGVGADISRYRICKHRLHSFWVGEGMLHLGSVALLETAGWKLDESRPFISDLVEVLPPPDAVLYLRAEPQMATEALLSRMSRFQTKDGVVDDRFNKFFGGTEGMAVRHDVLDLLADQLVAAGIPVITLQAHGDRDAMARQVLDGLAEPD